MGSLPQGEEGGLALVEEDSLPQVEEGGLEVPVEGRLVLVEGSGESVHCKKLEVNLTQKRSSQLQSGFIIQFKMGYLSCRIYTTSHFYHSVVLQCLCTQSSNMA